ncbi:sugar transporter [Tuber brumale]|nr:sugar transporter [Tuber brumale]
MATRSRSRVGAAIVRRQALSGLLGPAGLMRNWKVFAMARFACTGVPSLRCGCNEGVFSGVCGWEMGSGGTKEGWLTILELEAWTGTTYLFTILVKLATFCIGVITRCCAAVGSSSHVRGVGWLQLWQLVITFGIMASFWYRSSRGILLRRDFGIGCGINFIGGTGQWQKDTAARLDHGLISSRFPGVRSWGVFEKPAEAERFPQPKRTDTWGHIKLEVLSLANLFQTWSMFCRVSTFVLDANCIYVSFVLRPSIFAELGKFNDISRPCMLLMYVVGSGRGVSELGRKPVIFVGAIVMVLCCFIMAIIAKNEGQWPTHRAECWGAMFVVWLFVIHFWHSWGPCVWIFLPLGVRNNPIIGKVTPDILEHTIPWCTCRGVGVVFGRGGIAAADFEPQAEIT